MFKELWKSYISNVKNQRGLVNKLAYTLGFIHGIKVWHPVYKKLVRHERRIKKLNKQNERI